MGTRFAPGGARPAQPTTVAATRSEFLPGLSRPTVVFWLGLSLIIATDLVDYGPLATVFALAFHKQPKSNDIGIQETVIEMLLVGSLWLLSWASDSAGSFAILLLIALWVVWLVLHVNALSALGGQASSKTGA
jgi:hypothetical protein